LIAVWSQTKPH